MKAKMRCDCGRYFAFSKEDYAEWPWKYGDLIRAVEWMKSTGDIMKHGDIINHCHRGSGFDILFGVLVKYHKRS